MLTTSFLFLNVVYLPPMSMIVSCICPFYLRPSSPALNKDLTRISQWCCKNSLLINPDKTKVLTIGVFRCGTACISAFNRDTSIRLTFQCFVCSFGAYHPWVCTRAIKFPNTKFSLFKIDDSRRYNECVMKSNLLGA